MKTKEELNALKEEVETVNRKLHELTEEELAQVSGGVGTEGVHVCDCGYLYVSPEHCSSKCPCYVPAGTAGYLNAFCDFYMKGIK